MLNRVINYSFYLLFFLTPLIWTSLNFELFEYNKMIFVYLITAIITGAWIIKSINEKRLIINRTPLDIPLLLFLGANILSTIFSIDPHTSIWGYYSRSNGGLLSLISYLLLYYAFVSNIEAGKVIKYLKAAIFSGVIISVWGIWEHFGVSLSCVILRGEFNASCWIQDVQARVFATLGQPNWMAAYLAMLIFPALYFLQTAPNNTKRITYFAALITMYLAFTFTYSRGPTIGLIAGILTLIAAYYWELFLYIIATILKITFGFEKKLKSSDLIKQQARPTLKYLSIVFALFLIVNILFGSALTSFRLVSKFAAPARPSIALPVAAPSGTQLENGGTESGQIRLIVWQGALEIFKHYPVFGTGVETFAYAYYQFRPVTHNLTSEWDFLYNKAHNEFLNYLATTGAVGFLAYMSIIIAFIFWSLKKIMSQESEIRVKTPMILIACLLAAYVSFLVQAFFLFSVVITNLFFFLFPAFAFTAVGAVRELVLPKKLFSFNLSSLTFLNRYPFTADVVKGIVVIVTIYSLYSITQLWYADTLFNLGEKNNDAGNPGRAYNMLTDSSGINSFEPFYRSELGYAAASAANALSQTDATLSGRLTKDALAETYSALSQSPKNVSFWRTAIRTFFELSLMDKKYTQMSLDAVDTSIKLAPTDPKLYLSKATILESESRHEEAQKALQKAIELKPNYLEAYINLAKLYIDQKNYEAAIDTLKTDLKILPNDPQALSLLAQLEKMGVSTESAASK